MFMHLGSFPSTAGIPGALSSMIPEGLRGRNTAPSARFPGRMIELVRIPGMEAQYRIFQIEGTLAEPEPSRASRAVQRAAKI
jgi:hypothetical protein